MKKSLLFLLIVTSFNSFGQVDPDLFRTWHLTFLLGSDLSDPFDISEIEPLIRPFIIISETTDPEIIEINGEGACNTFSGTYDYYYSATYSDFIATAFTNTQDDCGVQIHNRFENDFFDFIGYGGWYEINQDSQGLALTIQHPLMGYATFTDYPLSVSENNRTEFKIYPNPVSEALFITSEKALINKIAVYSITGEKVLETKFMDDSVDVSSLQQGMYFLEIISETGRSIQKFIKK